MPKRSSQIHTPGDEFLPDLKLAIPLRRAYTYPSTLDIEARRAPSRSQHPRRHQQNHDLRPDDLQLGRVKDTIGLQTSPQSRESRPSTNKSVLAADRPRVNRASLSNRRPNHHLAEPLDTFSWDRDRQSTSQNVGPVLVTTQPRSSWAETAPDARNTHLREHLNKRALTLRRWYSQSARQEPYSMIADRSSPSTVAARRHRL